MGSRRNNDTKTDALRASRTLNPHPETVADEVFVADAFFDARDLVQVKYEMLRRVSQDGTSVSAAAAAFGFSRQSYYQAAAALAAGGLPALVPAKPGPRGAHKLTDEVIGHIRSLLASDATLRPAQLAESVLTRFGLRVHPRSIERALGRVGEPDQGSKSP